MISDNIYRDFLFIHYKYKDFIIDRKQFSRSVSFNCVKTVDSGYEDLTQIIEYGNERILNFDLDEYLTNTFKVEIEAETKLCIISSIDQLSKQVQKLLEPIFIRLDKDISDDAISFSISSKSEIKKYSFDEFKDLSKVYKKQFTGKGILSCFFNEDRIQYFIDIDRFLYKSLTKVGE